MDTLNLLEAFLKLFRVKVKISWNVINVLQSNSVPPYRCPSVEGGATSWATPVGAYSELRFFRCPAAGGLP
eukprot:7519358-Pyramimonas_sp.AAC.1